MDNIIEISNQMILSILLVFIYSFIYLITFSLTVARFSRKCFDVEAMNIFSLDLRCLLVNIL